MFKLNNLLRLARKAQVDYSGFEDNQTFENMGLDNLNWRFAYLTRLIHFEGLH